MPLLKNGHVPQQCACGIGDSERLTNQLVLDSAARALGKDCAVLPSMRIHPLCRCLSTQIASELHL